MRRIKLKVVREAVREVAGWSQQKRREIELYLMPDHQRMEFMERQSDDDNV